MAKSICILCVLLIGMLAGVVQAVTIDNIVPTYTGLQVTDTAISGLAAGVADQWFTVPWGKIGTKFEFNCYKGSTTNPSYYVNVAIYDQWNNLVALQSTSAASFPNSGAATTMWVPVNNLHLLPGTYYAQLWSNNAPLTAAMMVMLVSSSQSTAGYAASNWGGVTPLGSNQDFMARITYSDIFPIGWYDDRTGVDSEIAAQGGQIVLQYLSGVSFADYTTHLGNAYSAGLQLMFEYNRADIASENTAAIQNLTSSFDSNPSLYGWYTADEPAGQSINYDTLIWAYPVIKVISSKPVIMALNPSDTAINGPVQLDSAYDIFMYDDYPCNTGTSEFQNMNSWAQGLLTAASQAQTAGRPFYGVIQAYAAQSDGTWSDKRLPTYNEERFMIYWSIINGAKGIMYWSHEPCKGAIAQSSQPYPYSGTQWLQDVSTPLTSELYTYMRAVKAGPVAGASVSDSNSNVNEALFEDPYTGDYYLMAAKSTTGSASVSITFSGLPVTFAYAQPMNEPRGGITLSDGTLSDTFASCQVHIYKLTGWTTPVSSQLPLYNGSFDTYDTASDGLLDRIEYFIVPDNTVVTAVSAYVSNSNSLTNTIYMRIYDSNGNLAAEVDKSSNWSGGPWAWLVMPNLVLPSGNYALHLSGNGGFDNMMAVARSSTSTAPLGAAAREIDGGVTFMDGDYLVLLSYYADDTTPPTGCVSINSGATYCNSTSVTLSPFAQDTGSGVTQMRFSNDSGTSWSSWEAYNTTKAWTLTTGDGSKTVMAQYIDAAGNTAARTASIILDTTPPTGSLLINSGATYCSSTSVTLTPSAYDSSGITQMRFSNNNGTNWSGWEAYNTSKAWTLTTGVGTKTVMAQYMDGAGNTAARTASIILQ